MNTSLIAYVYSEDTVNNMGYIEATVCKSGTLAYKLYFIGVNGNAYHRVYGRNLGTIRLWINRFCREVSVDGYRLIMA